MDLINNKLRKQIKTYIKNHIDISDLIHGISIKGENLAGAIITHFNRPNEDMSDCNLSRAIIGVPGEIINLNGAILRNSNFKYTQFLGKLWMRRVDAKNCNFSYAFMPYIEYQYSNFRNSIFCETIMKVGSKCWLGADFTDIKFKESEVSEKGNLFKQIQKDDNWTK